MGVTYKLKEEVIDYIIKEKKENPRLSVRKLAELISQAFQVKVSKSSVSAVLKQANLSSSIGRRSEKRVKNKDTFKIPEGTKKRLLEDVKKVTADQNIPSDEKKPQEKEIQKQSPSTETADIDNSDFPNNYMAAAFIKVLEWKFDADRFWERLLSKRCKDEAALPIGRLCSCMMMEKVLDSDEAKDNVWWSLNGLSWNEGLQTQWRDFKENIKIDDDLLLDYFGLKSQLFNEALMIQISLKDDSLITIDPLLSKIWKNEVSASYAQPLERAMGLLADQLFTNEKTLMFHSLSNGKLFEDSFKDLMLCLLGEEDKSIQTVKVKGKQEEVLLKFNMIVNKPRFFSFGVYPQQIVFKELSKGLKWAARSSFYDSGKDRTVEYSKTSVNLAHKEFDIKECEINAYAIFLSGGDEPDLLILTNLENEDGQNIICQYLDRWPNLDKTPTLFARKSAGTSQAGDRKALEEFKRFSDFDGILSDFFESLVKKSDIFGNLYRDISNLKSNIYKEKGRVKQRNTHICVDIKTPKDSEISREFDQAVKLINDLNIVDYQKKRVIFSMV